MAGLNLPPADAISRREISEVVVVHHYLRSRKNTGAAGSIGDRGAHPIAGCHLAGCGMRSAKLPGSRVDEDSMTAPV